MNAVDVVLILLLLFAALRGFRQGAVSQIAAFGGAALGMVAGAMAAPALASRLVSDPGMTLSLLTLGLLLLFVAVGQILGVLIGSRLRHAAHTAGGAGVDRSLGIGVGVAGLIRTVWLAGSVLAQGPTPTLARQVRRSEIVSAISGTMPPPPDVFGRVSSYLDRQGFPTVFSGLGGSVAPPVAAPPTAAVAAAQRAGAASTVQVLGTGCGGISSGSGFVTRRGFVVTNAHVVAGTQDIVVRDRRGEHKARPILVDSKLDLSVLSVPDVQAPAIRFVDQEADRGTNGATLGYPGGQRNLVVKPAAVRGRGEAIGRDIYGRDLVTRKILTLSAAVRRGDSGGPFVTSDGRVGGVVFAAAAEENGTGYALTAESVRDDINRAIQRNRPAGTGSCRF